MFEQIEALKKNETSAASERKQSGTFSESLLNFREWKAKRVQIGGARRPGWHVEKRLINKEVV